jgi:hypothetical protein
LEESVAAGVCMFLQPFQQPRNDVPGVNSHQTELNSPPYKSGARFTTEIPSPATGEFDGKHNADSAIISLTLGALADWRAGIEHYRAGDLSSESKTIAQPMNW